MKKRFLLLLVSFLVCLSLLLGCTKKYEREYADAVQSIAQTFNLSDISIDLTNDGRFYGFTTYSLDIESIQFSDLQYPDAYSFISKVKKVVTSNPNIVVVTTITSNGNVYDIDPDYDYVLLINNKEVYNSIAEKNGSGLTKEEKTRIDDWIYARYEYYDTLTGKYCGDKYTDIIFLEASEKFKVSIDDLGIIWSQYHMS